MSAPAPTGRLALIALVLAVLAPLAPAADPFVTTTPGKPGSGGLVPLLVGSGPAAPGSTNNALTVSDALAGGPAVLVLGLSELAAPFQGGVMGPDVDLLVFGFVTDGAGGLEMPFALPHDVPDGLEVWCQFWISDPGALAGRSATNTLRMTVQSGGLLFPDYEDPHPPGFHPLGDSVVAAYRLDEGMTYYSRSPTPTSLEAGWPLTTRDDIHQGSALLYHDTTDIALGGFSPSDACTGDLDGDGILEPIFVGIVLGQGNHTGIRVGQPGQYQGGTHGYENVESEQDGGGWDDWWTGVWSAHCAAGDLDGDGVDELVLTESRAGEMQLRIVRRYSDGGIPVFGDVHTQVYPGSFGRVALIQLDADSQLELVVAHGTPGGKPGAADLVVDLHDDLTTGLAHLDQVDHFVGNDVSLELVAGQFDGDPEEELAIALQTWQSSETIHFPDWGTYHHFLTWTLSFDWTGDDMLFVRQDGHGDDADWEWDTNSVHHRERFVAADLTGNGLDEVCWLDVRVDGAVQVVDGEIATDWDIFLRTWAPMTGGVGARYLFQAQGQASGFPLIDFEPGYRGGDLAVVDDDGTGDDNLLVTLATNLGQTGTYAWQSLVFDTTHSFTVGYWNGVQQHAAPRMCGGDFDGEGLRLRYTGVKSQQLADPIPMVLLAAPPTKAAIAQNHDGSGSTYTVSDGTSQAYEVSTATSVSITEGYQWEDLTGNFGATVKATVSSEVATSTGSATAVTTSQVFGGSHEADTIVFQGTLHTVYEYEVVAAQDPSVVGTLMTVNVPVATKVFKWTTDFFDAAVEPEERIPDDVFVHALGDPASYRDEATLEGLLTTNGGPYEGWEGSFNTVGQGSSSNGVGLQMDSILSQGQSHTFGVEVGAEFKVGGPLYGVSVACSSSSMYEVSVTHSTVFDGTVGDIAGADWIDWFYDFGMVVYTRDDVGEQPFQVLDYWTLPLGAAYP